MQRRFRRAWSYNIIKTTVNNINCKDDICLCHGYALRPTLPVQEGFSTSSRALEWLSSDAYLQLAESIQLVPLKGCQFNLLVTFCAFSAKCNPWLYKAGVIDE
jgi:hypothetical protein